MSFTNSDLNPDVKRFCMDAVTDDTDDEDKLYGSPLSCKDQSNCWVGVPIIRHLT